MTGWGYIVANRSRGVLYVGVTADLPRRDWKIQLIEGQNPDWRNLHDDLANL